MSHDSDEDIRVLIERLTDVLRDIDRMGIHAGSVMAEAENRLLEEHSRPPSFSNGGGTVLAEYRLDTQSRRWWVRGTDVSVALARISDSALVEAAERLDAHRDSALVGLDEYADRVAEAALAHKAGSADAR
jgi:hypothetical protein